MVEVAVAKDPLTLDLVQVTIRFAVLTGLLLASASWAVMVTLLPAAGLLVEEVTIYLVAAPAKVDGNAAVITPELAGLVAVAPATVKKFAPTPVKV